MAAVCPNAPLYVLQIKRAFPPRRLLGKRLHTVRHGDHPISPSLPQSCRVECGGDWRRTQGRHKASSPSCTRVPYAPSPGTASSQSTDNDDTPTASSSCHPDNSLVGGYQSGRRRSRVPSAGDFVAPPPPLMPAAPRAAKAVPPWLAPPVELPPLVLFPPPPPRFPRCRRPPPPPTPSSSSAAPTRAVPAIIGASSTSFCACSGDIGGADGVNDAKGL
jgi:hypothetical protein